MRADIGEAIVALEEAIVEIAPKKRQCVVQELQGYRNVLTCAMGAQEAAFIKRAGSPESLVCMSPYSGCAYLRPIGELLGGRRPERCWREEWVPLMIEWLHVNGYPSLANSEYVESNNSVATNVGDYAGEIRALVDAGWCREDAEACTLLTNDGRPGMARALREGSNVYAASTYTLCDVLTQQARRQEEARQRCGGALPVRLYRNLQGRLGLLADDPNWSVLDREVRRTDRKSVV